MTGLDTSVEMEDDVESKDCSAVEPDSDFMTPLLAFVDAAGVERFATDTAGTAVVAVIPGREDEFRSGLFFMFFRDSSRGLEILEVGAAGVLVTDGPEVKIRGAVLTALGVVMVRSMVGAGAAVVAGVVSGTSLESESREGADFAAGALSDDEVEDGLEKKVKEGAGAGSEAGAGLSGSGSSKTFCIWVRAAFFSMSRSFTVMV